MQYMYTALMRSVPLHASLLDLRFNSFSVCLSLSSPSEVFCDSQRNILKENDVVRFPKLADTYRRIAEEGPDVFYNGSMAQSIVEDIQAAGLLCPCFITDN